MTYRPHCLAKNERNQAMIADYLAGMSRQAVADKYGIHKGRLGRILNRQGIVLPEHERRKRQYWQTPPKSPGRPPVWTDCPPELRADYALFRRKGLTAAQARGLLDTGVQA
jgi:hypothetical protein